MLVEDILGATEFYIVMSNGPFGILEGPIDSKYKSGKKDDINKEVRLINFTTGEECHKKLYNNTKGLHFKHSSRRLRCSSNGAHYLDDFKESVVYIPFQFLKVTQTNDSD